MDFTINVYKELLNALFNQGFSFITFNDFIVTHGSSKKIVLRHDVDKLPDNSLLFAETEAGIGIKGTYYFRTQPQSFNPVVIEQIAGIGHEVGYHYEDVSLAADRLKAVGGRQKVSSRKYVVGSKEYEEFEKKLVDIAIESFSRNLEKLRKLAPVKTICMHGSPLSRWDSRLLWKYYDYHDFGIIGEPYFDIDFNKVLYLTDTGRRWDGGSVAIRDKAQGSEHRAQGEKPYKDWKVKPIKYRPDVIKNNISHSRTHASAIAESPLRSDLSHSPHKYHSTSDIISAAINGQLPDKIMMTFHPQRWTDKPLPWVKELMWQNVKNIGKYFLIKLRD